jgi:putative ABC transport system substrate-binding protein
MLGLGRGHRQRHTTSHRFCRAKDEHLPPDARPPMPSAPAAFFWLPARYLGADPVEVGLITSLNRPGGNLTGVVTLNVEVAAKRMELLHELVPTATIFAALVNPTAPVLAETATRDLQAAARTLGLQLHVLQASSEREIDTAYLLLVGFRRT